MTSCPDRRIPPAVQACIGCNGPVSRDSRSGKCRTCINRDPDFIARRSRAIQRAFMADPAKRERHRRALAEANSRPERRELARQQCVEQRLWEKGLARVTPEVRARQGRTQTEQRLSHIPLERRDEYRVLAKKYGAAEATRIMLEHHEAVLRRAHA